MILVYDGKQIYEFPGVCVIKPPSVCVCTSCDIACDRCTVNQSCDHHETGTGGLCVSHKVADTDDGIGEWFRVAHFPMVLAYSCCTCEEVCTCQTGQVVRDRYAQDHERASQEKPTRPAGTQRTKLHGQS